MLLDAPQSKALNGLCSGGRSDLMDTIDSLRSQGINHLVSLPQIIVCGDQSSGKSSVLEAISGVPFPVKSSLCTRFPTELVLRRSPQVGVTVSITPDHTRSDAEAAELEGFHGELKGSKSFAEVLEDATAAMGIATRGGRTFCRDILRIEISGPDRPHLTIVDLPGLIHSETKNQSAADVNMVHEVVQSYMKEPRSIILAVVSAKNDIANQAVLARARQVDPTGNRTLGVITKPDMLHAGSGSEKSYVALARNEDVDLRLGWHVLRNMDSDSDQGKGTLAQRSALESAFFSTGIWAGLPSTSLGIEQLRCRLSEVLLGHITAELPSLVAEIDAKRAACSRSLTKLGQPRAALAEQQLYLLGVSESFQRLVASAVDANCGDPFFKAVDTEYGYQERIRAVIRNLNTDFAEDLARNGRRHYITENPKEKGASRPKSGIQISRKKFVDEIEAKMRRSRGRELPGLYDPMIIGDLFREEAEPWEEIASSHVLKVWKACRTFLRLVVGYIADPETCKALIRKVLDPEMDKILAVLKARTREILKSHQTIHPITYDQQFADKARKIREARIRTDCSSAVMNFFNANTLEQRHVNQYITLSTLVDTIAKSLSEPSVDHQAASEALDYMEAYYNVAISRFQDDIAVEAVEVCLVSALRSVLSPVSVFTMTPDLVASIAGESEDSQTRRDQLVRQLAVLTKGAETCRGFVGVQSSADAEISTDEEYMDASYSEDNSDSDRSSVASYLPGEVVPVGASAKGKYTSVDAIEPEPEPEPEPVGALPNNFFEAVWGPTSLKKKKKKKGKKTTEYTFDD